MALKPVSNGELLCQRNHRYEEKQRKNNGGWTHAFRPKKRLDVTDKTNLGPIVAYALSGRGLKRLLLAQT